MILLLERRKKMWFYGMPLACYFLLPVTLIQIVQCSQQNSTTSSAHVKFLPGFDGSLPFYLETGYVGVGNSAEVQLFYYFVKSESDPKNDPLLLWLTGGPGCSSFSGLAYEIGPLSLPQKEYNGSLPILVTNQYSSTKFSSIIFLDQPVNTGFSYATTESSSNCTDVEACNHVYEFLKKWFIDHPEFSSNPFYVSGDSYAGMVIPPVVQLISDGNEAGNEPLINFKGYSLGNPKTTPEDNNYQILYSRGMGLISDQLYESLKGTCNGEYREELIKGPNKEQCLQYLKKYHELIDGVNWQHILEPFCGFDSSPNDTLSGQRRSLNEEKQDDLFCRIENEKLSAYWARNPRVQEALHVRKGTIKWQWSRCQPLLTYETFWETISSSLPYHEYLSSKGYTSLIYSGDHDMLIPFLGTVAWIDSLNYSVIDDWRPWIVNGQIGGYTKSFANNMTFATVKGGGHTAPEYKPKECFYMLKRWITQQPL